MDPRNGQRKLVMTRRRSWADRFERWWLRRLAFDDHDGQKGLIARHFVAARHRINHVAVPMPGWPAGPPLRIAVLADLHLGSHEGDISRLQQIVAEVNALGPDIVLLPGDFINAMLWGGGRIPPERLAELLIPLQAPLGRFAVLGNHDRCFDAARVEHALKAAGISVLENQTSRIWWNAMPITLLGLADARSGKPDLSLLSRIPENSPTLIITHDPVLFAHLPAGPHLMVSGHTHGGQIKLPLLGIVTNASDAPLRWTTGLIEEDGKRLFVSTGLGTSGLPFRLGVPPEVALLRVYHSSP